MSYPADRPRRVRRAVTGGGRGIGRATGAAFAARGATVCLATSTCRSRRTPPGDRRARVRPRRHLTRVLRAVRRRDRRAVRRASTCWSTTPASCPGRLPRRGGRAVGDDPRRQRARADPRSAGRAAGDDRARRGHVVNVASMAGKLAVPGMAVYNASKFGALGLSLSVRAEFADTGVSVSAVLPAPCAPGWWPACRSATACPPSTPRTSPAHRRQRPHPAGRDPGARLPAPVRPRQRARDTGAVLAAGAPAARRRPRAERDRPRRPPRLRAARRRPGRGRAIRAAEAERS